MWPQNEDRINAKPDFDDGKDDPYKLEYWI
jgi:hypothetical protein